MQRTLMLQDFMQDLRIGMRSLMRVPMLTLTIVATVGIGIGATAAIFSAINAAMLRPLPYAEPDRLVRIYTDTPPFKFRFSAVDYLAFTEQQTRFEQYGDLHRSRGQLQQRRDRRTAAHARRVVGLLLPARRQPVIGRDFSRERTAAPARRRSCSRATRSGSSDSAAAPTRSASRSGSTAPTTRWSA